MPKTTAQLATDFFVALIRSDPSVPLNSEKGRRSIKEAERQRQDREFSTVIIVEQISLQIDLRQVLMSSEILRQIVEASPTFGLESDLALDFLMRSYARAVYRHVVPHATFHEEGVAVQACQAMFLKQLRDDSRRELEEFFRNSTSTVEMLSDPLGRVGLRLLLETRCITEKYVRGCFPELIKILMKNGFTFAEFYELHLTCSVEVYRYLALTSLS